MIKDSNEFNRRILNSPAIRPSETVPFSTLLSSLIELGHSIAAFKSRPLFTNRKNATNSIHLVEIVLIFLEELTNAPSRFEFSICLCLSELHFIFQKIHFLLEDCTRDGAKLWMLMKSEEVSTHFRVLMRAVAVALEVLPLAEWEMDTEVEELVEFVKKQSLKSQFEVEMEDRRNLRRVLRILEKFEGGIAPECSELRRVFKNLGIRSWSESNCEVKLLESEIGHEFGTTEKRDVGILSSLIAFLIYCRCTLFLNCEGVRSGVSQQRDEKIGFFDLDDFRCPISLEVMVDPVTISTGQTYDRSSILKWFKSGNHTCPVTGENLLSVSLVQNLTLKRLIQRHFGKIGISSDEFKRRSLISGGGSVAAEQATALVAAFLVGKMVAGEDEEKDKSAFECRLLTKTNVFNRSCLVEAGVISSLMNLASSGDQDRQENVMAALLNLSKYSKSIGLIVENGGIDLLVGVLKGGVKSESRQHAAGVLFYLTSVEDNRCVIGQTPGAISGLMDLIREGSGRAKKNAMAAILGLLKYPENQQRFLANGLVFLLANVLRSYSEREDLATDSLAILVNLAESLNGATAITSAEVLPLTIEILSNSESGTTKEYCVSLLLSLCINDSTGAVPFLAKDTSLMVALYTLLTKGTSRSSKKAGSLIKILHSFNERSSMVPTRSNERFVRVW